MREVVVDAAVQACLITVQVSKSAHVLVIPMVHPGGERHCFYLCSCMRSGMHMLGLACACLRACLQLLPHKQVSTPIFQDMSLLKDVYPTLLNWCPHRLIFAPYFAAWDRASHRRLHSEAVELLQGRSVDDSVDNAIEVLPEADLFDTLPSEMDLETEEVFIVNPL